MNNQIKYLLEKEVFRCLVFKFVKMQQGFRNINNIVQKLIETYKNDKEFYLAIKQLKPITVNQEYYDKNYEKYSYVVLNYPKILSGLIKPDFIYLDIGCGTGYKTKFIGNNLGIPDENIYGVDIKNWSTLNEENRNLSINFSFIENLKLPYEDNKFDFISVFMVLHHIEDLVSILTEISRVLKPGGIFMIKEHDCPDDESKLLVNVEHIMYDYIKIVDFNHLQKDLYYIKCYSKEDWVAMMNKLNFKIVKCDYDKNKREEISPTRSFHSIFIKNNFNC